MINITLAISTEFFDSFAKLPKQIQRKVTAFINKFRNNPTATGINYEKIVNAADKNIFSVRIDDTYRGIIAKHEQEGTYILLWVDHHDEAYAWATRKKCRINPTTGNLQIYEVQEEYNDAPKQENSLFINYNDEQLLKLSVPEELISQVRSVCCEQDLYSLKTIMPDDAYENIEWLMNGFSYDEVINYITNDIPESNKTNSYAEALKNTQSQRSFVIVDNNEETHIKLKVQFNETINCPTISVTVKDFHGKEMCGNNTNFMGIDTGLCEKGEEYIFDFEQKLKLAPGKYTISISCSRFDDNGELIVMNRNYDALIIEV